MVGLLRGFIPTVAPKGGMEPVGGMHVLGGRGIGSNWSPGMQKASFGRILFVLFVNPTPLHRTLVDVAARVADKHPLVGRLEMILKTI